MSDTLENDPGRSGLSSTSLAEMLRQMLSNPRSVNDKEWANTTEKLLDLISKIDKMALLNLQAEQIIERSKSDAKLRRWAWMVFIGMSVVSFLLGASWLAIAIWPAASATDHGSTATDYTMLFWAALNLTMQISLQAVAAKILKPNECIELLKTIIGASNQLIRNIGQGDDQRE